MIVITIHPLLAWLQRHRVPGWLAVVLTMLVAYTSLVALAAAAAQRPHLVEALTGFAGATRQYVVVSTVFGLLVALVDVAALYWLDVPCPGCGGCWRSSPTSGSCSA